MRKYSFALIAFLLSCFFAGMVFADTHNAANTTHDAVQAAVNAASPGDTVSVPSGESTWTSYVEVTTDNLLIQGAGAGSTIIHKFGFRPAHNVDNWRITGFTFDGDGTSSIYNWTGSTQTAISVGNGKGDGGCKGWRIDHNTFVDYRVGSSTGVGCYTIVMFGFTYGLIDNNTFVDTLGETIVHQGADGAAAFSRAGMGGYENGTVYIEDNDFSMSAGAYGQWLNIYDSNAGARVAFRHNTISDTAARRIISLVEDHGHCNGGNNHVEGSYSMEVHDNTYTTNYVSANGKSLVSPRGGTGVVFNNTIQGSGGWDVTATLIEVRSYQSCSYGGFCPDLEGYPCMEQIGDENGDGITTGDFYVFYNTSGTTDKIWVPNSGAQQTYIQANRDYYKYTASFTGATGIGRGTQAARPATCTAGVVYWDTTNSELDKCTSTNTWTEGWYTPYTYPHPLQDAAPADTDPPTPDPQTWASEPAPGSGLEISMTLTAVSDLSGADYYLVEDPNSDSCSAQCGADYGAGGDSSGEQASNSYTDTVTNYNQCYCYNGYAEDNSVGSNTNTASSVVTVYSNAVVPGTPGLSAGTDGTTQISFDTLDENGNPTATPNTEFACKVTASSPSDSAWQDKWINTADGTASAAEVWAVNATWDGLGDCSGFNSNTTYTIACKARNGDDIETALGTGSNIKTDYPPVSGQNESLVDITLGNITISN